MSDLERASGALSAGQQNVTAADLEAAMLGLRLTASAFTNKQTNAAPTSSTILLIYNPATETIQQTTLAQAIFNSAALINGRDTDSSPPQDAYLLLYDPNVPGFIKTGRGDLYHDLPEIHDPAMYTEKNDPDDADWIIFYDVSESLWHKVQKSDLIPEPSITTLQAAYPIGSVYMNVNNSTNPNTLLGFGTWEKFSQGRVLVGEGDSNFGEIGTTRGARDHTLTINEMPSHQHTIDDGNSAAGGEGEYVDTLGTQGGSSNAETNFVGGGQSHNNVQPSLVVYMWKRTE
ncbi:MAG: hypothetical protein AAF636_11550 [Pseudomonadota bacterium]